MTLMHEVNPDTPSAAEQAAAEKRAAPVVSRMEKVKAMANCFKQAAAAAEKADPGELADQKGCCNFDTPAFTVPGMLDKDIKTAASEAGLTVGEFKWFGGKRWYWLWVPMNGQAWRRSAMMEAAQAVLSAFAKENPWFRSCGYRQMD